MGYFCNIIQFFTLVQTYSANFSTVFLIMKNWIRVASSFSVSVCSESRSIRESKAKGWGDATQCSLLTPRWAASLWTWQTIGRIPAVRLRNRVSHQAKWEGRRRRGGTAAQPLEWMSGSPCPRDAVWDIQTFCRHRHTLCPEPATTQQQEGVWSSFMLHFPDSWLLSARMAPTQLPAENASVRLRMNAIESCLMVFHGLCRHEWVQVCLIQLYV